MIQFRKRIELLTSQEFKPKMQISEDVLLYGGLLCELKSPFLPLSELAYLDIPPKKMLFTPKSFSKESAATYYTRIWFKSEREMDIFRARHRKIRPGEITPSTSFFSMISENIFGGIKENILLYL